MADKSSRDARYYPYAGRYGVNRRMPETGRSREEILRELRDIATEEDRFWQTGRCSGTMYCGDMEHYGFLKEAFGMFGHVNALQRDMCPSMTRFEGEIIAMTLDMLHADAAGPGDSPCGSVTSGGTESILSAILAYREEAHARGIDRAEIILPETAHVAFEKGAHLFGLRVVKAPIDPVSTQVDVGFVRSHVTPKTIALIGSASNYGYGTIDPIDELSKIALEHGIGLHVDGCLGGFILPWGEALGYDIPVFDFRHPGVTTISADTHKYGYGPKGSSVLAFRSRDLRKRLYFMQQEWSGGKYLSPGIAGSRSGGLLAATWASMVSLGREGYLRYAKRIFETSYAMQDAVRKYSELRILGKPTFCFSFLSDAFDIYHVNDFMRERGWRFNGQQHPNALHMCVTRPQTQGGVVEAFTTDLAAAVGYAKKPAQEKPITGAVYGGLPKGDAAIHAFVESAMAGMLDSHQDVPAE
ncbi:MAG: aspartate aminotransferase family protein [Deltaproteobacteria bacterium]|nr:aspartate aminotransferase family protein [Deltaproteobacteria bacterium]